MLMACMLMACMVMACMAMACIVIACIAMAYIVVAAPEKPSRHSSAHRSMRAYVHTSKQANTYARAHALMQGTDP